LSSNGLTGLNLLAFVHLTRCAVDGTFLAYLVPTGSQEAIRSATDVYEKYIASRSDLRPRLDGFSDPVSCRYPVLFQPARCAAVLAQLDGGCSRPWAWHLGDVRYGPPRS